LRTLSLILIFIFLFGFSIYALEPVPDNNVNLDTAEVDSFVSNSFFVKIVAMLGFGGLCGFVTGFALKKVARIFAVILGVIFIVIQFFAFKGWITVDWNQIAKSTDLFTGEGASRVMKSILNVLTTNLPFGSSFLVGLFMGVKKR